jgi:hypothetical protein
MLTPTISKELDKLLGNLPGELAYLRKEFPRLGFAVEQLKADLNDKTSLLYRRLYIQKIEERALPHFTNSSFTATTKGAIHIALQTWDAGQGSHMIASTFLIRDYLTWYAMRSVAYFNCPFECAPNDFKYEGSLGEDLAVLAFMLFQIIGGSSWGEAGSVGLGPWLLENHKRSWLSTCAALDKTLLYSPDVQSKLSDLSKGREEPFKTVLEAYQAKATKDKTGRSVNPVTQWLKDKLKTAQKTAQKRISAEERRGKTGKRARKASETRSR